MMKIVDLIYDDFGDLISEYETLLSNERNKLELYADNLKDTDKIRKINDKIDNQEPYDLLYWMLLKELISNYYYKLKIFLSLCY